MTKKSISLVLILSLMVCCLCILCGCDLVREESVQANTEATVTDSCLVEAGTLTVGVDASNTPYGGKNSSGDIVGYDVDYANAVGAQMGLKVKIVDVAEDGKEALETKQVDVVFGMQKQATKKKNTLSYANSYLNDGIALFCKEDAKPASISDVNFGSVKVLAQAGTDSTYAVQKAFGVSTIVVTSSIEEAFEGLQSGTADYMICNAVEGAYYARNYEGVSFVNYMSSADITPIYAAVLAANSELLNGVNIAVQEVASNGEQSTITNKWLSSTGSALIPGGTDTSTLPAKIEAKKSTSSKSKKSSNKNN